MTSNAGAGRRSRPFTVTVATPPRAERVWRPTSTDDAPRVARPLLAKSFERVNDDHARPERVESCFPPVTLVVVQERSELVRPQPGEHHVLPLADKPFRPRPV